jgi:hypothetical protein
MEMQKLNIQSLRVKVIAAMREYRDHGTSKVLGSNEMQTGQ